MKPTLSLIVLVAAAPAGAETQRQLDAHIHGVATLDIAIEGRMVAMSLQAPGADIVGFEYVAESDADVAAVEAAIVTLSAPLDLFVLPEAANCAVSETEAELEIEGAHDDHEHSHGHDSAHEETGDGDHDDHAEHDGHVHEEDDMQEAKAAHSEFHAEYTLNCETPEALTEISFAYFDAFPNAVEVEVQLLTAQGARAFEVDRDAVVLYLEP